MREESREDSGPQTVVELLKLAATRRPRYEVLRSKEGKEWSGITGERLLERVRDVTLGLHKLGLRKGDSVAMLAESSPLWSITDYAILSNGAINVPIYPTQAVHQVEYILKDSAPKLLVLSTARQAKRIGQVLETLPDLPIVTFQPVPGLENSTTIDDVEADGRKLAAERPELYDILSADVRPDDVASIIYTSGTTGEPKGATLTHSNIVFNTVASGACLGIEPDNVMLSFLPLSHIFERMVLYLCLHYGVQINYAGGIETVAGDMKQVRPTLMSTVPRMLEKVYARMQKTAADGGWLKRRIFDWSLGVARRVALHTTNGDPVPLLLGLERRIADRLVFAKLREAIGGRMKRMVSGGAALPREIALVFNGAGIPVLQGYGLTETSPVIAVNTLDRQRAGSVGLPLRGVEVKLDTDGELLTRGPHVFQGYFKKPDETREAFVEDSAGSRWFRTGDIAQIDKDGFITITDRKKDLIKTSAGKYVTPQLIEGRLIGSEFIEQAVVIGNDRKYVAALIVPDFSMVRTWAQQQGISLDGKDEIVRHPRVFDAIKAEVVRLTRDLADYEKVKRVALVPDEFTIDGGELTPTLKVRRRFVEQKYRGLVESLYSGAGSSEE
ncbi:MAG TPA: long-chain fatty acid--CoA ligase [Blastocatellia bacterium]|nr:long-chain fatty acid--CoA ligase [Blastocatellia bacterium]